MDLLEYRDSENKVRHPWETARLEVMLKLLRKWFLQTNLTVADIGCGDTFVVNSLATKFPDNNYLAVDTAFTEADIDFFAKEFSGKNIKIAKDVNAIKDISSKIDIVLLMDVIEHIEDEVSFLQNIVKQEFIIDDSLFFITVPAFQSLFTAHDKHLLHYRRYSRHTLKQTLRKSGLEIIDSGYFFTSLMKVRILQKLFEIIFGEKEQKGLAVANFDKRKAKLIKSFLILDFRISRFFHHLGIKIPGLSTYAICRKSIS
jgi:hypothetical protein